MKCVTVNVTDEDIAKGMRNLPGHCPIALAFKRANPSCSVLVGTMGLYLSASRLENLIEWNNPEVSCWIMKYDNKEPVGPIRFIVDIPGGAQ
jgi:hypothetical protein